MKKLFLILFLLPLFGVAQYYPIPHTDTIPPEGRGFRSYLNQPITYGVKGPTINPNYDGEVLLWYDFTRRNTMRMIGDTIMNAYNQVDPDSEDSLYTDMSVLAPIFNSDSGAMFDIVGGSTASLFNFGIDIPIPFTIYISFSTKITADGSYDIFNTLGSYPYKMLVDCGDANLSYCHGQDIYSRATVVPYKPYVLSYGVSEGPTTFDTVWVNVNEIRDSLKVYSEHANLSQLILGWQNFNSYIHVRHLIIRDGNDTKAKRDSIMAELYEDNNRSSTINIGVSGNSVLSKIGFYPAVSKLMTDRMYFFSDISTSGHNISQQKTAWEQIPMYDRQNMQYVIVNNGLVDLDPAESASTAIARYQVLIDSINSDVPSSCEVIVLTMTPNKTRLINLYGETDGLVAYQKYLDMNEAIMGNGAFPLTGVDIRSDAPRQALDDGSGDLKAEYDSGDYIHENDAGRVIIANILIGLVE